MTNVQARRSGIADQRAASDALSAPTDLSSLFGWWDPSDTASITSAVNLVSQLNDKSGNARHLVQATGVRKPSTNTRTINSLNALDYVAASVQNLSVAGITLAHPVSVFQVVQADLVDSILHWAFGRVSGTPGLGISTANAWEAASGNVVTYGRADTSAHILSGLYEGATSALYVDGALLSTSNVGNTGWVAQAIRIGGDAASANWDGILGETIVYNRELTPTEFRSVHRYLGTKWGISVP